MFDEILALPLKASLEDFAQQKTYHISDKIKTLAIKWIKFWDMIHPSKILAHPWEESKFCNAIMKTAHKKWPCSPTAKKEMKIFVLIFFLQKRVT